MNLKLLIICFASVLFFACSCTKEKKETTIIEIGDGKTATIPAEPEFDIVTNKGTIRIKLYKDTPKHRDNFAKLAITDYYNGQLFHRVIKNLLIQTGDPTSKDATPETKLGKSSINYTIPAEILPQHKNKHGAVGAVQGSNAGETSGSQFYIIQNKKGADYLNGEFTVFGEVTNGLNVVDSIGTAKLSKENFNRPIEDIRIEKIVLIEN